MNKEEIEKKKKMLRDFSEKGQGQRVFFEEDLELIRDILKELEQKESKLNKVTDKLKEVKEIAEEDKEQKKIIELPNGIKYKDKVISLDTFIFTIENLLEIIEGEKE